MKAFKVYTKENLLYVVDNTTGKEVVAHKSNVLIDRDTTTSNEYLFKGIDNFNDNNKLLLSDIEDESGVAYNDGTFQTFRNEETGGDDKTLNSILSLLQNSNGTFGYVSGVSGTVTLTGGKKVKSITAVSTAGGTVVIDGGDSITIPANGNFTDDCNYNLVDPTIVFTGTVSYYVSYIS